MGDAVIDIRKGDFIQVKADAEFRPAADGMVMSPPDADGELGLVFHYDRFSQFQRGPFEGIEAWHIDELDLETLER